MSTTAIIAELLVIGFLALATILFFVFSVFEIKNFDFLLKIKDFSAIMAVLITILAYLFGALHNHLSHSIFPFLAKLLQLILHLKFLRFMFGNRLIGYLIKARQIWIDDEYKVKIIKFFILENGSVSTIERIKYMQSLSRLFSSTSTIIPFFAASLVFWLVRSFNNWRLAFITMIVSFLIFFLSATASFTVYSDYLREANIANETIRARMFSGAN